MSLKKCKDGTTIVLKDPDPFDYETKLMELKIPYWEKTDPTKKASIESNKKYHDDRVNNNDIKKFQCTKCLTIKPYYDFRYCNTKRGRQPQCTTCGKIPYKNNKQKYKDNHQKRWTKSPVSKFKTLVSIQIKRDINNYNKTYVDQLTEEIWDALPYTPKQLCEHLESQFEPWMNWKNHSKKTTGKRWEIDHIIPRDHLKFSSIHDPNFLKCWSLENMRPLEWTENKKKSNS